MRLLFLTLVAFLVLGMSVQAVTFDPLVGSRIEPFSRPFDLGSTKPNRGYSKDGFEWGRETGRYSKNCDDAPLKDKGTTNSVWHPTWCDVQPIARANGQRFDLTSISIDAESLVQAAQTDPETYDLLTSMPLLAPYRYGGHWIDLVGFSVWKKRRFGPKAQPGFEEAVETYLSTFGAPQPVALDNWFWLRGYRGDELVAEIRLEPTDGPITLSLLGFEDISSFDLGFDSTDIFTSNYGSIFAYRHVFQPGQYFCPDYPCWNAEILSFEYQLRAAQSARSAAAVPLPTSLMQICFGLLALGVIRLRSC